MTDPLPPNFFVVGGTLKREAPSYISRPADGELFRLTLEGEYCNVLASRQMGKSSLMVRTAERLRRHGVRSVIVDLTRIGSSITASQWYLSFIAEMAWQLDLDLDVDAWWLDREERGPVHNFSSFLRDVVFREISDPIVVFVDEIDSTLNLEFTDDFFAAIRAAYNARANDERYERLTFVLLGVARPADLVKDRTRTPYNIGNNTDLTDFRIQELGVFQDVLEVTHPEQGEQILQWVLDWTGGQPYLTQKLCETLIERKNGVLVKKEIDSCVTQLFLGEKARKESNLMAIRDRVKSSPYLVEMLKIYQQVLRN
ncbi:MAG: AAA-like domain-containing protein, partial [Anaerolineales bacterium]